MKSTFLFTMMSVLAVHAMAAEPAADLAIAQKYQASLVRVEYTLQVDKADSPEISGWGERCPNCGQFHSMGDGSELIQQERPLVITGFVLAADKVLASDPMIHPRFIQKIQVRYQDTVVAARPAGYHPDHGSVLLQLEKPIPAIQPLEFDKSKSPPFKAVTCAEQNGRWTIGVEKVSTTLAVRRDGPSFLTGPAGCLLTDADGTALAVCMTGMLPLDNSWQRSPLDWPLRPAQDMEKNRLAVQKTVQTGILRVKLDFRSPKKSAGMFDYSYDENENVTEINVAGIIVDPNHVLVLAKLQPKVTARLERITVDAENGNSIEAAFEGTFKDYGAFMASLDKPLPEAVVAFNSKPVADFENTMLFCAEVRIQGESKSVYVGHNRISSFATGWHGQLEPSLAISMQNRYVFDTDGKLVALSLPRRKKIERDEDRWMYDEQNLIAACYLQSTVVAFKENLDENNVPLSEEDENRIAWLGVELQPLNEELARINKASSLTNDGQMGAIISFVYPNSPASRAGLEMGDILIRLHFENLPKPLDVSLDNGYSEYMEMFPWDQLSEIPEEYYDQLPTPWPSVDNTFARSLTDMGFDTPFKAELLKNGEVTYKNFSVTQSPSHYGSAKQFKSESLGLTARNMTYEVNRYFRLKPDEPGVIISKVQPGSKASVSGIKPYEIITHVNAAPVSNVDDLEKMIRSGGELKLSVKRMTKGRVVSLKIDPEKSDGQSTDESVSDMEKGNEEAIQDIDTPVL